jgi:hypothetical protein
MTDSFCIIHIYPVEKWGREGYLRNQSKFSGDTVGVGILDEETLKRRE